MKIIMRYLILILGILCFFVQSSIAKPVGILAVVGNDVVSSYDVEERIKLLGLTEVVKQDRSVIKNVIDMLIDEKLYKQEAEKLNIKVKDKELEYAIRSIEKKNNVEADGIDNFLKEKSISKQTLIDKLTAQIIWNKIVSRKISPWVKVSDDEVKEYLEQLPTAKTYIQEYLLSEIALPVENSKDKNIQMKKAKELIAKIQEGERFESVAKSYSKSTTAINGGKVGWINADTLPIFVKDNIISLTPGKISEPILTPQGIYIFKVNSTREAPSIKKMAEKISLKQIFITIDSENSNSDILRKKKRLGPINKEVKNCKNFDVVVKKYMPSISTDLLTLSFKDIHPDLQPVVSLLKAGGQGAIAQSSLGLHFIIVCSKKEGKAPAVKLTKKQAKEQLIQKKTMLQADHYIRNLRRKTLIETKPNI